MKKIMKIWTVKLEDPDGDLSYLTDPGRYEGVSPDTKQEYKAQDNARIKKYYNGKWWFIGIQACATIGTSYTGSDWLINELSSGGLWGIESDSEESYHVDADGRIFGIKGYGVINKKKQYGTLDTIDDWNWVDYTAVRREVKV